MWNTEVTNGKKYQRPTVFWGFVARFPTSAACKAERTEDALYNRLNRGEITLHYLYINVVF